jgi:hypothetical protein
MVGIFWRAILGPRQPDIVRAVHRYSQLLKVHAGMAGFFTPTEIGGRDREFDFIYNYSMTTGE